jgi:hypothetical protein
LLGNYYINGNTHDRPKHRHGISGGCASGTKSRLAMSRVEKQGEQTFAPLHVSFIVFMQLQSRAPLKQKGNSSDNASLDLNKTELYPNILTKFFSKYLLPPPPTLLFCCCFFPSLSWTVALAYLSIILICHMSVTFIPLFIVH